MVTDSTAAPVDVAGEGLADLRAGDRIRRLYARFICAGYLGYLVLMIPNIGAVSSTVASWWTPAALIAAFGPPLLGGVLSFRNDTRWLPLAYAASAIGYLVATLSFWPAWDGSTVDQPQGAWIACFPGLASIAAAGAWNRTWAFVHLAAATTSAAVINDRIREFGMGTELYAETVLSFGFCALFVAGASMAMQTGRILEESRDASIEAATEAASAAARAMERRRFDALTHDGVLATLLAASRRPVDEQLSRQAATTLAELDSLREEYRPDMRVSVSVVVAQLRSTTFEVDDTASFAARVDPGSESTTVPIEVARTFTAAVAEAVRNSRIHAGRSAVCAVTLLVTPVTLEVVARDNGTGFDPDRVAPNRLGIAASIRGRMQALSGGSAAIASVIGTGTEVRLRWTIA